MRRIVALLSAFLTCGLSLSLVTAPALAASPFSTAQAPGFFRTMVGAIEVTALYDGAARTDVVKALQQPADATQAALEKSFLHNPLETSDNAYLVNTGTKLILIDTGGGAMLGPTFGRLQQNLRAAGYAPDQVDDILLTHMHRDHIGGLVADGRAVFPNAIVHADASEAGFWLSKDNLDKAAADQKPRFQGATTALTPYIAAGHFQTFAPGSDIVPGVHAMPTPGHSVGHTMYVIESNGQSLWLVGDLINVGAVQFDHPEISSSFDGDRDQATASRKRILEQAANQGALIGAAHVAFPGLGHVRGVDAGWRWVLVDYSAGGS